MSSPISATPWECGGRADGWPQMYKTAFVDFWAGCKTESFVTSSDVHFFKSGYRFLNDVHKMPKAQNLPQRWGHAGSCFDLAHHSSGLESFDFR